MIKKRYFDWLYDLVCSKRYSKEISYKKLFRYLHDTEFRYSIPKDDNRASDGVNLRWRYAYGLGYDDVPEELDGPCSVLEMMIALAIRCEDNIMDDPSVGDRTGQWFWGMVVSLGLGGMTDSRYDKEFVIDTIDIFLEREYEPDGRGGLFTIRNCDEDLRDVEIWHQLCWYLDSIM